MLLLVLQAIQIAILWVRYWVPLGRLNDPRALREREPAGRLAVLTIVQAVPYTVLFAVTGAYLTTYHRLPLWLTGLLLTAYGVLLVLEIRAQWWPYLSGARAPALGPARGTVHSVLPPRHGVAPDTLHCVLDAATLATLVLLVLLGFRHG